MTMLKMLDRQSRPVVPRNMFLVLLTVLCIIVGAVSICKTYPIHYPTRNLHNILLECWRYTRNRDTTRFGISAFIMPRKLASQIEEV